jgi:hypothetical protein
MRSNRLQFIAAVFACLVFFGCTQKIEEFTTPHLNEYLPLQTGKYITYRLDSTVFTNFGTVTAVHSYQEKQVFDAQITDALGRNSYRILRFIRDTAGTQPWAPTGSYSITPTDSVIEVNENNLRFIKLVLPIAQDNSWKGNRYLPDDAFGPLYSFNNDFRMDDWDYTYSSIDGSLTVNGQPYNDVLTVDGINSSLYADIDNFTVTDPSVSIAYVNYLQENYAKGIGLISQRFIMWEYQGPNATNTTGVKVGFGVKRRIIDHN